LKLRVKDELKAMQLSPKVEKVVNGELKHLLEEIAGLKGLFTTTKGPPAAARASC